MKKENVLYAVIGVLGGALISTVVAVSAVNSNNKSVMQMMGMNMNSNTHNMMNENDMDMSMNSMTESLKGKTGDAFDKAFINDMIVHHQGAIDMANLAKQNAKHDEIKKLSEDIITAQTKEIEQMRSWQKEWNYEDNSDSMHMMHGGN